MIVKRKTGFHVLPEEGKNLGGPYKTKAEAVHRLQQIEFFKHKGKVADIQSELKRVFDIGKLDPNLNIRPDDEEKAEPIIHDGKVVGFITPHKALYGDRTVLGNLYILPEYRGLGLGKKAALEFQQKYPDMFYITDEKNFASQAVAKSLGLTYTKRPLNSTTGMIFEKLPDKLHDGHEKTAVLGIPNRQYFAPILPISQPKESVYYVQRHDAIRAGCFQAATRIETDQGHLRIGDIVNNKLQVNVKSYNTETGIFEYKPIINWFKNGSTDEWMRLRLYKTQGITCTPGHKVYTQVNNKIKKVTAESLNIGDCLLQPDESIPEDLQQFIYGAYLGDGEITTRDSYRPTFRWGQAEKRKEYVNYFAKRLGATVETRAASGVKTSYYSIRYKHLITKELSNNYKPKKQITSEFLNKLDARALAVWFMDDGQWSHSKTLVKSLTRNTKRRSDAGCDPFSGTVYLYTMGFTFDENTLLREWLQTKFNFNFTIRERNGYYYLSMSGIEKNKTFFELVSPYMVKALQYKSPLPVGSYNWKHVDKSSVALYPVIILGKDYINTTQNCKGKIYPALLGKYDIEVADNHNYFASGVLVSNSHYDLRLNINGQSLTSWAGRSLPKPGEKVLFTRQPEHSKNYGMYEGVISSGYGAGKVKLFEHDKIEILKADPDHILFNTYSTDGSTNKYALIKLDDKNWIFSNITATEKNRPFVPLDKPTIKQMPVEHVDIQNKNQLVAPKYDGALTTFVLRPQKPIEAYSYRKSKRHPGQLIDYTFKTDLYKTIVPKGLKGTTIIRGELFGKTPQDTNAVLLSGVWRARTLPKLEHRLFDVEKFQGKDYRNKPYAEKLEALKFITGSIPGLHLQELKSTPEGKQSLIADVKTGQHPHTREGVVVYDLDQPYPKKAKFVQDSNVYLTEILPGHGRLAQSAGRLGYSITPGGPTQGYIGTGLSDDLRKMLYANPSEYIGKQVQITSEKKFPSGSYKVPVFHAFS